MSPIRNRLCARVEQVNRELMMSMQLITKHFVIFISLKVEQV